MRKSLFGRIGAVAAALIAAGLVLIGLGTPANATNQIYQASNVTIKVSGGDALALNRCLNDSQDGVINTQINSCVQVANAGNLVELDDSSLWVYSSSCGCGLPVYSHSHVDVDVTGGLVSAINECVNDAQDGYINTQINSCAQYATAGNLVFLSNVTIAVYA
jgi:hypothetical protein